MPGRELGGSVEASESPVLGTFKAHKALPRRKLGDADLTTERSTGRTGSPHRQSEPATYTTSERIKSWIPEPAPTRAVPILGRLLTPPLNTRDNFRSWIDDVALKNGTYPSLADSEGTTPLAKQSPPTPESTPPKTIVRDTPQAAAPSSRIVSDGRTESFRTAHENFSSEDEVGVLDSPSIRLSQQRWLRTTVPAKQRSVGLGLGLESEEDDTPTPRRVTSGLDEKNEEFITFDGVWGGETPDRIQDQLRRHTRKALKDNLYKTPLVPSFESPQSTKSVKSGEPGLKRDLSLRERVELNRHSPVSASTENFAEEIQWPLKNDVRDIDAEVREVNEKRLSEASTDSTVVAAMVVDSPPKRRQTLRHTGKILDVNATDTITTCSNRSSMVSSHISLRRRDCNYKHPDARLRSSLIPDNPESASTPMARQRNDSLIVIPDRRSSFQSSTGSSKRLSKTFSVSSRQQSSRPTTAPEELKSYFDVPRRDSRAVSVVIQQARPWKPETHADKELASSPATQVSLPAVPTSTALSPTTSVTSGGTTALFVPASPPARVHSTKASLDTQEAQDPNSDPAVTGDWSSFPPQSAMVTPFSLRSAHSSTPGTLEVNEATALSIYPHTNKSILVIQEIASKDMSKPREQSAIVASNASIAIPGTLASVLRQESPTQKITDSLLQNPRDPPQPPEFIKVIPPTPANAASSSDDSRIGRSASIRANRTSAPLSSIKRAFSARHYSDTFRSPLSRTFSLRNSATRRQSSLVENDEGENRLHPSWRPRKFLDEADESDSEIDFYKDGMVNPQCTQGQHRPTRTISLSNRLTGSLRSASLRRSRRASSVSAVYKPTDRPLPYEVVDDAIKRSQPLTRRMTSSLKLPRSLRLGHSTAASMSNQPHYEFVHPDIDKIADKEAKNVPGQGHQLQFSGFRGLVDQLERRRELKEEGKREARRDWLRGRIDYVGPEGDDEGNREVFRSEKMG
ncbi:MAG: hypothetical protein Q9217_000522 [Psora testacea]